MRLLRTLTTDPKRRMIFVLDITPFDNTPYEISHRAVVADELARVTFRLIEFSFGVTTSIAAASASLVTANALGATLGTFGAAASISGIAVELTAISTILSSEQNLPPSSIDAARNVVDRLTDTIPLLVGALEYLIAQGHLGEKSTALAVSLCELADTVREAKTFTERLIASAKFFNTLREWISELYKSSNAKDHEQMNDASNETDSDGRSAHDQTDSPKHIPWGDPSIGYPMPGI